MIAPLRSFALGAAKGVVCCALVHLALMRADVIASQSITAETVMIAEAACVFIGGLFGVWIRDGEKS